jgi:endonuclease G, mitochondrial
MRVRDIKQIVNRTAKEMETSLSTIVKETVDKTVLELNSKESIARRSQNLADSVLRPSKSEQERILALPQNLWVKGSNISRMEAFGFFAFPR